MARPSRNSPCPCGSGRRFKQCCGSLATNPAGTPGTPPAPGTSPASGTSPAPDNDAGTNSLAELEREAREGNPRAMTDLGLRHLTGTAGPPRMALGLSLIADAARAGDARGASLAATLAGSSLWRTRNWPEAFAHLLHAAQLGHHHSRDALRLLAAGPTGGRVEGDDWAGMHAAIDLDAWLSPPPRPQPARASRYPGYPGLPAGAGV